MRELDVEWVREGEFVEIWVTGDEVGVGRSVCNEKVDQYFCSGVWVEGAAANLMRGKGITSAAMATI